MVKISGKMYPLVFTFDAIASVETEYDKSILIVQEDMSMLSVVVSLLEAALGGALTREELMKADLPPIVPLKGLIQAALHFAYFGNTKPEPDEPKSGKKKKQ